MSTNTKTLKNNNSMSIDDLVDRLNENALSYLTKGLTEFDTEINFALLHFFQGVELVVKSILAKKNWQQVVSKPADAEWEKLCNGKLKTVGLSEAAKRIHVLFEKPICKKTLDAFNTLRTHRNQLTHFFHPTLNTAQTKAQVAKELLHAWFHLREIVKNPASANAFNADFQTKFVEIESRLAVIKNYFQTVFESEVQGHPDVALFDDCPSCNFKSLAPIQNFYVQSRCMVCNYFEISHHAATEGEVQLTGDCLWCEGEGTVTNTGYGVRCSECEEIFGKLITCECCGASFAGHDLDEDVGSYRYGCSLCEGYVGYLMNKND